MLSLKSDGEIAGEREGAKDVGHPNRLKGCFGHCSAI
jgi:hypothetical protein